MDKITYGIEITIKTKTGANTSIPVMLGRKRVGHIRSMELGFAYYPKGASRFSGCAFDTIEKVKQSIEAK